MIVCMHEHATSRTWEGGDTYSRNTAWKAQPFLRPLRSSRVTATSTSTCLMQKKKKKGQTTTVFRMEDAVKSASRERPSPPLSPCRRTHFFIFFYQPAANVFSGMGPAIDIQYSMYTFFQQWEQNSLVVTTAIL